MSFATNGAVPLPALTIVYFVFEGLYLEYDIFKGRKSLNTDVVKVLPRSFGVSADKILFVPLTCQPISLIAEMAGF
jgi:hypothetical protein